MHDFQRNNIQISQRYFLSLKKEDNDKEDYCCLIYLMKNMKGKGR